MIKEESWKEYKPKDKRIGDLELGLEENQVRLITNLKTISKLDLIQTVELRNTLTDWINGKRARDIRKEIKRTTPNYNPTESG